MIGFSAISKKDGVSHGMAAQVWSPSIVNHGMRTWFVCSHRVCSGPAGMALFGSSLSRGYKMSVTTGLPSSVREWLELTRGLWPTRLHGILL
jgi:hypothetical protein